MGVLAGEGLSTGPGILNSVLAGLAALSLGGALLGSTQAALAQATISTGNGFLQQCDGADVAKERFCLMYVAGVADAMALQDKEYPLQNCVPQGVTYDQRKAILLKYIRDNPEYRHYSTAFLYWSSLYIVYNCLERSLQRR